MDFTDSLPTDMVLEIFSAAEHEEKVVLIRAYRYEEWAKSMFRRYVLDDMNVKELNKDIDWTSLYLFLEDNDYDDFSVFVESIPNGLLDNVVYEICDLVSEHVFNETFEHLVFLAIERNNCKILKFIRLLYEAIDEDYSYKLYFNALVEKLTMKQYHEDIVKCLIEEFGKIPPGSIDLTKSRKFSKIFKKGDMNAINILSKITSLYLLQPSLLSFLLFIKNADEKVIEQVYENYPLDKDHFWDDFYIAYDRWNGEKSLKLAGYIKLMDAFDLKYFAKKLIDVEDFPNLLIVAKYIDVSDIIIKRLIKMQDPYSLKELQEMLQSYIQIGIKFTEEQLDDKRLKKMIDKNLQKNF